MTEFDFTEAYFTNKVVFMIALSFLLLLPSLSISPIIAYASLLSTDHSTSSEGCREGFGYYVDDPDPICEPLDKIGKGPPPNTVFCSSLGCPYNPPNLSNQQVEDQNNNTDSRSSVQDLNEINSTNDN
jgi:hypothetical protein